VRILLVEDDAMIAEAVALALKDAAYAVDRVADGAAAEAALAGGGHQAMLLDLGLPKRSGLEVLERLRGRRDTIPVIVISARHAVEDRIRALDLGADDYVLKPFDLHELLARLRAVIRRQGGHGAPVLSNGIVSLDPETREARRGDAVHLLSAREFALLHALLLRPGAILARSELEGRIYGWNEEVESNAVEFLIHGVRKKLGADAIRNVRGAGWMVDKPS
jgi:two-component system, OmpR family, response regulator